MQIADNIIKEKLKNVYFIWGSGKTTISNSISKKYEDCFVYHTDNRMKHFEIADSKHQPAMCRKVDDYWTLDPDDARQWESQIVAEFTPMIIIDLVVLASHHKFVICEGDVDTDAIINVVSNMVVIANYGSSYDFFDRPDQKHMLDGILSRTDLNDEEKQKRIENAYNIVGRNSGKNKTPEIPSETLKYGTQYIIRDDTTSVEETTNKVEDYFDLKKYK